MPYSRSYVLSKYPGLDLSLLKLFEEDIFPKFLNNVASLRNVDQIICASNDFEGLILSKKSKIKLLLRSERDLAQLSRREIVEFGQKLTSSDCFILINPLFPLVSKNTIKLIIEEMNLLKSNIFLGNIGACRESNGTKFTSELTQSAWDLGAVTAFYNCKMETSWRLYSNYSSLETLSIRNKRDFDLIKTMQIMGY